MQTLLTYHLVKTIYLSLVKEYVKHRYRSRRHTRVIQTRQLAHIADLIME